MTTPHGRPLPWPSAIVEAEFVATADAGTTGWYWVLTLTPDADGAHTFRNGPYSTDDLAMQFGWLQLIQLRNETMYGRRTR